MRRTIKTYYKATRPGATSFYDAKDAAAGAAWLAAVALVVRDLISDEQFQILYGPWASVMEAEE